MFPCLGVDVDKLLTTATFICKVLHSNNCVMCLLVCAVSSGWVWAEHAAVCKWLTLCSCVLFLCTSP